MFYDKTIIATEAQESMTSVEKAIDAIEELANELDEKRNETYTLFEENQKLLKENELLKDSLTCVKPKEHFDDIVKDMRQYITEMMKTSLCEEPSESTCQDFGKRFLACEED